MDRKTKGAWLVHHTQKLETVQGVPQFENIAVAGKAGRLLSGLAAGDDSTLTHDRVASITRAVGISKLERPGLLRHLLERRLLLESPAGFDILGLTTAAVLEHTADIFDTLEPSVEEHAAIDAAEQASEQPIESAQLIEHLSDVHQIRTVNVEALLKECADLGFVDREALDSRRALYFNGNLFRRGNSLKVSGVLQSIPATESSKVRELEDLLRTQGCVSLEEAIRIVGATTFEKVQSIGMFDVSKITNSTESVRYVTRPGAFSKYGDAFVDDALDLAKAFVTCLMYGMERSARSRGRIRMLEALMRKLIAGEWVGPATAIGEDYKVLEMKRVLEVRHGRFGYSMRLLKPEVGELALLVLTQGDASEQSLQLPGAAAMQYTHPERTREKTRKRQPEASRRAMNEVLLALRRGSQ